MHLYLNRQHSFLSLAENKNRIKNPALKDKTTYNERILNSEKDVFLLSCWSKCKLLSDHM